MCKNIPGSTCEHAEGGGGGGDALLHVSLCVFDWFNSAVDFISRQMGYDITTQVMTASDLDINDLLLMNSQ